MIYLKFHAIYGKTESDRKVLTSEINTNLVVINNIPKFHVITATEQAALKVRIDSAKEHRICPKIEIENNYIYSFVFSRG